MELIKALISNIDEVVEMNRQLFIDEQFDVIYSVDEITTQMKDYLTGATYDCYLIIDNKLCCGYCLLDKVRKPIYLRHLFIKNKYRRKGLGKETIYGLMEIYNTRTLDIDVMAWNEKALNFYNKIGFYCRYHGMRIKKDE